MNEKQLTLRIIDIHFKHFLVHLFWKWSSIAEIFISIYLNTTFFIIYFANLDFHWLGLKFSSREFLTELNSVINKFIDISLKSPPEVFEHCRSARQDLKFVFFFKIFVYKIQIYFTPTLPEGTRGGQTTKVVVVLPIFPYKGLLVSMGQFTMTSSTTSLIDVVKSGFANSYIKNLQSKSELETKVTLISDHEKIENYRVKKYFWSHEALVSNVDFETLFCYTVNTTVPLYPFDCIGFIFSEFFCNIWANIAEPFFYRLKN